MGEDKKKVPEMSQERRELLEAQVRIGREAVKFLGEIRAKGNYFASLMARIEEGLSNSILALPPEAKEDFALLQARRFQNYEPLKLVERDIELARLASAELSGENAQGGLL